MSRGCPQVRAAQPRACPHHRHVRGGDQPGRLRAASDRATSSTKSRPTRPTRPSCRVPSSSWRTTPSCSSARRRSAEPRPRVSTGDHATSGRARGEAPDDPRDGLGAHPRDSRRPRPAGTSPDRPAPAGPAVARRPARRPRGRAHARPSTASRARRRRTRRGSGPRPRPPARGAAAPRPGPPGPRTSRRAPRHRAWPDSARYSRAGRPHSALWTSSANERQSSLR